MDLESAPDQDCPDCAIETRLDYVDSNVTEDAGVSQQDFYSCPRCHGNFVYTHKDRKLRKTTSL